MLTVYCFVKEIFFINGIFNSFIKKLNKVSY